MPRTSSTTRPSRPPARTAAPRMQRQPKSVIEVEVLAGSVARRLQGQRRGAVVLGRLQPVAPFPVERLASAITRQLGVPWRGRRIPAHGLACAILRQLGQGCGKIAIPAVVRAIEHELLRQAAKPAV